jgi:hypothetical protein
MLENNSNLHRFSEISMRRPNQSNWKGIDQVINYGDLANFF